MPTESPAPKRLCIIVTASVSLYGLYRSQWSYWIEQGFDVHGVAGPGPEHEMVRQMGVTTHAIPMERNPSPFKDLLSLIHLWWFLLFNRFDIIHVSTPKASLLGALAARLSGHRRLVYTLRGRAYENMTGLRRKLMTTCEWIVCRLAARVIPICRELGQAVVQEGLCPPDKIHFIAKGSSNGVDLDRFAQTDQNVRAGREIRQQLGIADDDLVVLFVGWLRRDKGINELVQAFQKLSAPYPGLHLLLLGQYEASDPLQQQVVRSIENHPRIHHLHWRSEPAPVYAAADIVALPSYREGFGTVAIEAAAMELPVVATDIMGCREAVENGNTGLLAPPRDVEALAAALRRLIEDPALRVRLGRAGRRRAELSFRQELVWQGIAELYEQLLSS